MVMFDKPTLAGIAAGLTGAGVLVFGLGVYVDLEALLYLGAGGFVLGGTLAYALAPESPAAVRLFPSGPRPRPPSPRWVGEHLREIADDPHTLPPLRIPPGGRGPAAVSDELPPTCDRCRRPLRECDCARETDGPERLLRDLARRP